MERPTAEDLPDGTSLDDVKDAIQAAWLAGDLILARDLVQRYVDPDGKCCCMRCAKMTEAPWRMNNHLGPFHLCPVCAVIVTQQRELPEGDELLVMGPPQRVGKRPPPAFVQVNAPLMISQRGDDGEVRQVPLELHDPIRDRSS